MSEADESGAVADSGGPAGQDLVDFLTARYDELEAVCRRNIGAQPGLTIGLGDTEEHGPSWPDYQTYESDDLDAAREYLASFRPLRTLRDIAGKRKIVAMAAAQPGYHLPDGAPDNRSAEERACDDVLRLTLFEVLRHLAEEFAGHPAYKAKDWAQWPVN